MDKVTHYIKNLDSLIAALLGYYIVHLFTKYNGVGISPDSIMYLSTARNFHDHGQLVAFTNKPLVDFPIFYPVFLALTYFISGTDPLKAGPVIDALLFAGVIFLTGTIIQRFAPKSFLYKWLVFAAILLSPALLQVYTYLWSETLFILLVIVFFAAFSYYLHKRTLTVLIIAAVTAGICCITRYAGVTVIGTGGLLLLLDTAFPFKKRWKGIFTFGFIAIAFLIANLIRNHLVSGTTTGPRETSVTSFTQNLSYIGSVICGWTGFENASYNIAVATAALTIVALTFLMFVAIDKKWHNYQLLPITFSLVYVLFILISATFSRYEQINNRLLSPMYIPLVLALTSWIIKLPVKWSIYYKATIYLATSVIALFIGYKLYKIDYQRYDDQYDYGNPGYTDDDWKDSGIKNWLLKNGAFFKTNAPIYSDANEAVYFFSGHSNAKLLPHKYFKKDIDKFFNQKHYYIIWFNNLYNEELIHLKEVQQRHHLLKVAEFEDGAVFEAKE